MALRKIKLGELIEQVLELNSELEYGLNDVMGMTLTKEIIPTKADINPKELPKFIIVSKNDFIFNPRTHGMKIGFGFNENDKKFLISWNNIAFRVKDKKKDLLLPYYLWIWLKRDEWDRFATFNSWGSSTEVFSWDILCDMDIALPDLDVQQKYVDVYLAMLENQKAYERGLDDLKLVCDAYIEDLRRKMPCEEIGKYITQRFEKNISKEITNVLGISKEGFIDPRANMDGVSLSNYNIFYENDFVYSPPRINVGSIRLYKGEKTSICSPIYNVFYINDVRILNPSYLMMWLQRSEFLRSTDFYSIGSVRNNFDMDCMKEVKIPIPAIEVQQSIVNIYNCYNERKTINKKLKQQIKDICPILIKGSIEGR